MSDIVSVGIKADFTQLTGATTALDKFAAAAKPAAAGAAAVEKAGTRVAAAGSLARHELINLSRQAQDVGVSLVSGQSPFMVLAQQGTQIADIFGSSKTGSVGGALKQIGSGIASFLTPMRVLAGGVALAGAAAYVAYGQWKSFALGLDDAAKQAGVLSSEMAKLQAVASFKGIASDEFTKGIGNFSQQVYLSKTNAGGLLEVFRANGVAARDFTGSMEKAADLIKNAASDQQRLVLLQQMGLPATMEWVRLMSGGAEGIRKAKEEAAAFGGAMNDEMVAKARQFDEAWNKAWTNFGLQARSAVVSAASGIDWLIQKGRQGAMALGFDVGKNLLKSGMGTPLGGNFDDFYKATGAGAGSTAATKPTVDPAALQRQIALEQQRIGILGQLATAADAERSVELQVQQARLNGVNITGAQVEALKRLAAEQTLGISGIKAATDAWNVETATIGMGVGQATAYASAQSAINAAKQVGRALTADNIAAIQAEASALGAAAQNADNMRFAYTNLVQGPLQAFRSAIAQGASAMDALKKAGISALDSLSSRLMDMASRNLWNAAFGGSSGGGGLGGLLGGLFGMGGGGGALDASGSLIAVGAHSGMGPGDAPTFTRNIHPAYFDDAPRYHSGIGPGEQAAIIRKDESVLTPGQMKALAPVGSGASVVINQTNTFTNADPGSEARMRQALAQTKDMAVKEAVQAVANIKGTSPSYMKASR